MLDRLGGGDQAGVERRRALVFGEDFLTLLEDAVDRGTGLALGALADDLEHLLQAFDLDLGLALVGLERLLQLGRLGAPRHLGQRLQDRALGVVDVLERVMKQGLEIFLGHWGSL